MPRAWPAVQPDHDHCPRYLHYVCKAFRPGDSTIDYLNLKYRQETYNYTTCLERGWVRLLTALKLDIGAMPTSNV